MASTLGALDYIIIGIVLLVSAAVGIYYRFTGGKQKTTKEFLLADRSMPVLPVAFSLMTSFMSAVTLLSVPKENYMYGTMFVFINMSYVLATPIVVYLILPVFHRLQTASVYEYLEIRFGYPARLCASLTFSMQVLLYMGIVLYAPALALKAVTGLSIVFSVVMTGVVCSFYATIGGMKAVLVTDIFQTLLMFASVLSVIICAGVKAGGFGEIWATAQTGGRIDFTNFSIDPTTRHTWWTQIIGGIPVYLSLYGVNQVQVQRILAARDIKSARAALWWCLPILCALSFLTCFSGLCIYYYYRGCDPVLQGRISSPDQLVALFVVDNMSHIPGLSGLFVSGIFSASLSTVSSAIHSLAATTLEDYLKPLLQCISKKPMKDSTTVWSSKILAIVYGAACVGLAFAASSLSGLLQAAFTLFGICGGPLLGLFTLGMYVKSANQKGAITGLLVGLVLSFWIGFGQPKPAIPNLPLSIEECAATVTTTSHISEIFTTALQAIGEETTYFYLYRISYMWYSTIGFLLSFFVGLICSFVYAALGWDSDSNIYTDATRTQIKYELFVPPVANYLRRKQTSLAAGTGGVGDSTSSTSSTVDVADEKLPKSATSIAEENAHEKYLKKLPQTDHTVSVS